MCVVVLIFPMFQLKFLNFCPYYLELSPDWYVFVVSEVFEFLKKLSNYLV